MDKITLYQYETCPYCARVRRVFGELGLLYDTVEVSSDPSDPLRKEIIEKSGCQTVPVVRFGDKYIGDSQVIVEYARERYSG